MAIRPRFHLALHWQIAIGLAAGALLGAAVHLTGNAPVTESLKEIGQLIGSLFIRLLTMVAVPLVVSSLIAGASSISDPAKLGRIGITTLVLYLSTTAVAISIGLLLANLLNPGGQIPAEVSDALLSSYQSLATDRIERAQDLSLSDQLLALVPANPFRALTEGNMIQTVLFAVGVGLALALIPRSRAEPVIVFFDAFTAVLIKMVELIMRLAPYGVFALIATVTMEFGFSLLGTLGWYSLVVLIGLTLHTYGVYGSLITVFARRSMTLKRFFKTMGSVQLLAFSSSSSAATLPLTMEAVRDRLGVSERITSFVLPLGATVNMDGTALYQGVAAIFIAQVYGLSLTIADQLVIVLTATLASIGTAAIPGAGIVMLVIVLEAVGIPVEGVALIFGVDRLLDMCRTVVNVTGDAAIAVVVSATENELKIPDATFLNDIPLVEPGARMDTELNA